MTIKFTKTGFGNEKNNESLLFEFLDHELSDKIELRSKTLKSVNSFVGSLQTSQITGTLLELINFSGKFFGDYVNYQDSTTIRAKQRFDQLQNLNGRPVKFWIDGFKVIVIISKLKLIAEDYNSCGFDITLQPHDFIEPPVPILVKPIVDTAVNLYNRITEAGILETKLIEQKEITGVWQINTGIDNGIGNPNNKDPEQIKREVKLRYHKAREAEKIAIEKATRDNNPLFKLNLTDQQISKNISDATVKAQKEFFKLFGGD